MAEETNPNPAETKPGEQANDKATPAGKKAKAPAIEDKPFNEFIQEDFNPTLQKALGEQGISDLKLDFAKQKLSLAGNKSEEECWQVIGTWQNGQRQFNLYFLDESINGKKAFSSTTNGAKPSTLESFMIDERKVSLDLMVLYTLQRLNGQKWLTRN